MVLNMNCSELISGTGVLSGLKEKIDVDLYYIASIYNASLDKSPADIGYNLIQVMDSHLMAPDEQVNSMIESVRVLLSSTGDSESKSTESEMEVVL